MAVTAMQKPDHRTIGKFRLRHLDALGGLFVQGYNAQAAVDAERQVIVATEVYAAQNDAPFLDEMLAQIRSNTGRQARELSADYGYL
jgi:hypothetical protein